MGITTDRDAWDAAMSDYLRYKGAHDRAWAIYQKTVDPSDAFGTQVDDLCNASCDAEHALIELPAPDLRALEWKLGAVLQLEAGDVTAAIGKPYVDSILSDVRRFAVAADLRKAGGR